MISTNNQNAQEKKVGTQNKCSKCCENFLAADFENTITMSYFVGISIMTTSWKSSSHSAVNGIDLVEN
jgi:hypothetical protein